MSSAFKSELEPIFIALETNLDATATMFSGLAMGEKPCKLLNISVGGARIASEFRYHPPYFLAREE